MSRNAYRRAERCFALARSATFDGERKAAIARGTAIAKRAGLDLDDFDIPGRARQPRPTPERLFEGNGFFGDDFVYRRSPWGTASADDLIRAMDEMVKAATRQERDLSEEYGRRYDERIDAAILFLASKGVNVCKSGGGRFFMSGGGEFAILTTHDVVRTARRYGWAE